MYAVIMAGGVGTRFWPRSRHLRPKQLLSLSGSSSMIRLTIERLKPLLGPERILVVTRADQLSALRAELPEIPDSNILVEPTGKNTAPCIALAAAVLEARGGADEAMLVLPADHLIRREEDFRATVAACENLLAHHDHLITLGVTPHRPETGYGYIRRGSVATCVQGREFHTVERFLEKPDLPTARSLVQDGRHLWNSGMFAWRTSRIVEELRRHIPDLEPGLASLRQAYGTPDWGRTLNSAYQAFPKISIDYGVMERAEDVWVTEVDIGWSDVGSWASLAELRAQDAQGNVLPDDALAIDARDNFVDGRERVVVLLGVQDLIVVDTEDALLVCHRDRAQEVGSIPEQLRRRGRKNLT
ncbi:MAG: mannose-1-phosphate guanylyltransferase [Candidatus Latescibacterota bacterium]|nr:MAG: mannose-1-phosphate guanylyltransferase [Candidatus Latescibacterota bacterium]